MATRTEQLMVSNIPALGTRDLFRDADTGESDLRFVSEDGELGFTLVASAVGIVWQLLSQFRVITQLSTLEAGGTTGVYASFQDKGVSYEVFGGEKLRFVLRDTANVATTDVMGFFSFSS
jgi:hypothetical protein